MDDDVLLALSLASQYAQNANFAGTPRQAVADGYSAVDAVFTALLKYGGHKQPRNHAHKFAAAKTHFPDAFAPETTITENSRTFRPGADWESLSTYYAEWLRSRYETFTIESAAASGRVTEALNVVGCAVRYLARKEGEDPDALEKLVAERAFGFQYSRVQSAVGDAHDHLFSEAEIAGEIMGAKLGTKLASATNDCELDIIAGDKLTQDILCEDEEIATEAARVYFSFVQLMEKMREKRLNKLSNGKPSGKWTLEELGASPDFMLSMKVRYHGAKLQEMGSKWGRLLAAGVSLFKCKSPDESAST